MAYQTISKIFQRNDADLAASEAHGLASGLLCIDNQANAADWLRELLPEETVLLEEDKTVLVALFEQTRKLLNEDDHSFRYDLFLPSDDDPLQDQLEAVRSWCEGFLFGVGFSRSSTDWPGDTGEIMKDIVEFTKLDSDVGEELDDDEMEEQTGALIEVQEYLRAAVMIVRDQFLEESKGLKH